MSKNLFWKTMHGELPPSEAAMTLGAKIIEVSAASGAIEVEFEGKPEFTNPLGDIQGGFLTAMLDGTMGPALHATLDDDEFAPTVDLKTSFVAPAKIGKLTGLGRVVSKGRSVCFVEGELQQDGKLIAKSTATAVIRKIEC